MHLGHTEQYFHLYRSQPPCMCLSFSVHISVYILQNLHVFLSLFSLFSWRYFVVTGLTKVSLSASQSVRLSAPLCLSPSFSGVTPFWHYYRDSVPVCLSRSELLSVSPSLPLLSPLLMLLGCDRSRVNLSICVYRLSFSLLPMLFPSEWCWKWKSCTSQHSRGWTSCTCEHKTSGDAVTSCLLSSVRLVSADISQILKKFEKLTPDRELQGSLKRLSGGNFWILLQMGPFAGVYQNIFDNLFHTIVALAGGFQPKPDCLCL